MEDPNAPATKGDIAELDQRIEMLRGEVNHGYNDVVERISDAQTQILTAFYEFAQSDLKRMTALEGNEAAIGSRLATIEERRLHLEQRVNMPPAPN